MLAERGGPRYQDIIFKKQGDPGEGWTDVVVLPDVSKAAFDRVRAAELAAQHVAPLLAQGHSVNLDFTGTKMATQAFCHALLVPLCQQQGPLLLQRLRFTGCSPQVKVVIRMAVNYGLRE